MPEREYFDYDEWMNAGGDPTYGQAVSTPPLGSPSPAPPPSGPKPVNVGTPPPYRPGYEAQFDPTTGTWNYVPIGGVNTPSPPPGPQGYEDIPSGWPGGPPGPQSSTTFGSSPMLNYPAWQSAGPFQPRDDTFDFEPFSYEAFAPTSYGDLEKQPGFAEGQQRLQKQIEAGAAHQGMLRSGMTLGNLWTGLDTNKQQRFAEFDGRRARDYTMNRGNAFEGWAANLGANRNKFLDEYGIDKDKYTFQAADTDRGNNYRFNAADASFKDALARWTEQVRSLTQIGTAGAN